MLRPDSVLTSLVIWVLAVTARQFDVAIHVAVVMSTHFHLVVTVPDANVSEFMHRLDLRLAKSIQVLRKFVKGVVWAPGQLSIVELKTTQAVAEQIAYAIANPVKAGLVYTASDWPGLTAKVTDLGHREVSAARPEFYFTGPRWDEHAVAAFKLTLPDCLAELGTEPAHAILAAELEREEREARAHVKAEGWKVMGRIAAANASPYRCAKSWRDLGKLNPHIAAGRGQNDARRAAIAELRAFRADHAAAKKQWIDGDRSTMFPAGTYWMLVHHRAPTATFS